METGVETQKPVEVNKPLKIERFGEEHFDYLLGGLLEDWHKAEVAETLGRCFRAERILPNGDHVNLYINTDTKEVTLSQRSGKRGSWQNSIKLQQVKEFEVGRQQMRFMSKDQVYLIGSKGQWHFLTDKGGPREPKKFSVQLEI